MININSRFYLALITTIVLILIVVNLHAQGTKKSFTKDDLPAAVKQAFQTAYPNATINNVGKEKEHGTTFFEIESVDGKTHRDLLYTSKGKVYEIEETISSDSLPDVVMKTLKSNFPKATIVKAEKVTQGTSSGYELQIKIGKKTQEVEFDSKGSLKSVNGGTKEKDEKDEDDDDDDNE